ncbi:TonB-dependent receptor [Sphingomonas lenta]|uniref:TonB-dependent receptor n=1 Tax=Sphingomonas lenta TaxID=1141887 RepID=A0A2A2SCG1_9SPHN|nr:TonB-dependent receptor [Sphingomonas lenta]PAX06946.1 hypothetical protein CKY28_12820 [Sphingomonas lenta]
MRVHARGRLLASVAATSALIGMLACPAAAQTAEPGAAEQTSTDEPAQDIIVTGIRASLAQAIDRKRSADQVVDVITADDIGKLPDDNIAESIQRVTGVQITRDEGEGRGVNIRGLTAQTTINGRVQVGANSRNFDFRNLAAEFFQTIEVFKSPLASQPEGALGGTVNLVTRKPLDGKPVVSIGVEGLYADYAEKLDPRVSFFASDQFADDTLGVALSGAYQRRHVRSDYFQALSGWRRDTLSVNTGFDFNPGDTAQNRDVIRPADLRYRTQDGERTRYGVDGTIQWRPSDRFEVRFDGTYTRFENVFRNAWFRTLSNNPGSFVPGSLVISDQGSLLGGVFTNQRVEIDGRYESEPLNLYTFGGNARWEAGRLTVTADANYAKSDFKLISQFLRFEGVQPATVDFRFTGEDVPPTLALTNANGSPYDLFSPALYVPNLAQDRVFDGASEEIAGRLDFDYRVESGILQSIKAGVRLTTRDDTFRVGQTANQTGNRANPAFYDQATGRRLTIADAPLNTFNAPYPWRLFEDEGGTFPRGWLIHRYPADDPDVGSTAYLDAFNIRDFGGLINSVPEQSDIKEDTQAAYVMADFSGDIGSLPFRANAGVRYVRTEITSRGLFNNNGVVTPVEGSNVDERWLPAANITFNLRQDLLLRIAAARVLQRPAQASLATGYNINLSSGVASLGNPQLDPFLAKQVDVSLEWYPTRETLFSFAAFYKDVENFTAARTFTGPIPGVTQLDGDTDFVITQPVNAGGGKIKGFEVGVQLPLTFLPEAVRGFGVIANYTYSDSSTTSGQPIGGLSKQSANLIGYFERGGFSTRVAYSWRSRFAETGEGGNQALPLNIFEYIAPAGYLDASISYDFSPNFSLVLDGVNLLRTKQVRFTGIEERLRDLSITDRRISFGGRIRF